AGLHPDVGPYDRIGVAIIRNDVVVAFRHHHHVTGHHALRQRGLETRLELAALEDVEADLGDGNSHIADSALEPHTTRWKLEHFPRRLLEMQRLGGAREPEADMHHIIARR